MTSVTHYILFKTPEQYKKAHDILCEPTTVEVPGGKKRWGKKETCEVILMSATGTHCWPDGRGQYMWVPVRDERQAKWWEMIQQALKPLKPYYTDDLSEVTEFYGET